MAKAKKKFPDLNKDGKITKADILKGRGVFKKGGKIGRGKSKRIKSEVDFDMNLPTPEVRSKSANIAKSKMKQKLAADLARSKGGKYEGSVVSGRDVPEVKLYQDQKTGEYIARPKLSSPAYKKGGKLPKYNKGGKTKSRVNEAGNYTKPGMRKRLFESIKAGSKGGRPGQWSARKAQLLANRYKKAGGGYKN